MNLSYSKGNLALNIGVESNGKKLFVAGGSVTVDLNFEKFV